LIESVFDVLLGSSDTRLVSVTLRRYLTVIERDPSLGAVDLDEVGDFAAAVILEYDLVVRLWVVNV
jgi:hypothetical protein